MSDKDMLTYMNELVQKKKKLDNEFMAIREKYTAERKEINFEIEKTRFELEKKRIDEMRSLALSGMSFQEIGEMYGISTKSSAKTILNNSGGQLSEFPASVRRTIIRAGIHSTEQLKGVLESEDGWAHFRGVGNKTIRLIELGVGYPIECVENKDGSRVYKRKER